MNMDESGGSEPYDDYLIIIQFNGNKLGRGLRRCPQYYDIQKSKMSKSIKLQPRGFLIQRGGRACYETIPKSF